MSTIVPLTNHASKKKLSVATKLVIYELNMDLCLFLSTMQIFIKVSCTLTVVLRFRCSHTPTASIPFPPLSNTSWIYTSLHFHLIDFISKKNVFLKKFIIIKIVTYRLKIVRMERLSCIPPFFRIEPEINT